MARYDIRRVFREISDGLLREYFRRAAPEAEIDWSRMGKRNVEELFRAYAGLDDSTAGRIASDLTDLFQIYTHPECTQIVQQLMPLFDDSAPLDFPDWSIADRCMWIQMHCNDVIKSQMARLIGLESISDTMWTHLKLTDNPGVAEYSAERIEVLRQALSRHMFQNFGYGRRCVVEPLMRERQGEECYFVYLDKPGRHRMQWDADRLVLGPDLNSYEMVIVYNCRDNELKVRAPRLDRQHRVSVARIWSDVMRGTTLEDECLRSSRFDLEPFKLRESYALPEDMTDDIDQLELSYAALDLDGRNLNKVIFSFKDDKDVMDSMEEVFANPETPRGSTVLREIRFHIRLSEIHGYRRLICVKFTRDATNCEEKNPKALPVLRRLFREMGLLEAGDALEPDEGMMLRNSQIFQYAAPEIERRIVMVGEGGAGYAVRKSAASM